MNISRLAIVTVATACFSSASFALDCTAPEMPDIPERDDATTSEMDQAKAEVKDYIAGSREYLGCVQDKQMNLAASATEDEREAISDMYDTMVDKMESVYDDMSDAAEDFRESTEEKLAEADAATRSEQQAVANMYDEMVLNLQMASNEVKQAYNDFRDDTEEEAE